VTIVMVFLLSRTDIRRNGRAMRALSVILWCASWEKLGSRMIRRETRMLLRVPRRRAVRQEKQAPAGPIDANTEGVGNPTSVLVIESVNAVCAAHQPVTAGQHDACSRQVATRVLLRRGDRQNAYVAIGRPGL
jgi:hypothetical protein